MRMNLKEFEKSTMEIHIKHDGLFYFVAFLYDEFIVDFSMYQFVIINILK